MSLCRLMFANVGKFKSPVNLGKLAYFACSKSQNFTLNMKLQPEHS